MSTKKKQLKLYITDDLDAALRSDAAAFGLDSAQAVVEEVLKMYLPFWREVKQAQKSAYDRQSQDVLGKVSAPLTKAPQRARRRK